jgi:hypothetical protein
MPAMFDLQINPFHQQQIDFSLTLGDTSSFLWNEAAPPWAHAV